MRIGLVAALGQPPTPTEANSLPPLFNLLTVKDVPMMPFLPFPVRCNSPKTLPVTSYCLVPSLRRHMPLSGC